MHLTKKIFIGAFVAITAPLVAFAQYGLEETGKAAGLSTSANASLPVVIGRVISAALGLVGVVFLILMIYGGYLWMIARGNDDLVTKAKDNIRSAIIGLIIVVGAYAITYYIVNAFAQGGGSSASSSDGVPTSDNSCANDSSCPAGQKCVGATGPVPGTCQ